MTDEKPKHPAQIALMTCGAWWLPHTARAFAARQALACFWITMGNHTRVPGYKRCWPFQAAMLPLYRFAPQIWCERAFYSCFPLWKAWLRRQTFPECNVIHAIVGYATEPFAVAERTGALKVVDCPNSHPVSYYGFWQRECDLWCPGEKVPIPQWMFARMNRELDQADLILCPSTFVLETMVTNGIPGSKCFVSPFGVDTTIFNPRPALPQVPRFISVGTICLRKGHQYLFRAFELVKRKVPNAQLICAGHYKCDFRRERSKWAGSFEHYPSLAHPELAKLLQTCSAFVMASVEEGFARVLSEAMGAGLPIIGTHESGATTLVQHGVEGLIVPPRDVPRLASAMIQLASDKELNRKMGEAAYQKGATRNTWQDYGDRLLAEYETRLRARPGK